MKRQTHGERIAQLEELVDELVLALQLQSEINQSQARLNQALVERLEPLSSVSFNVERMH